MNARLPMPDQPFSVADARAAGISESRLRGHDLARPFRGVRAPAEPTDARSTIAAYAPRLAEGQVFAGASAAVLWGLPIPRRLAGAGEVTLALAKSASRTRTDGALCREVKPSLMRVELVDGLPVTDPLLTWCLLAKHCVMPELVRVGDALVSENPAYVGRRPGFVPFTVADLAAAADRWRGCVGVGKLRATVPHIRTSVASPPESDLRMFLVEYGVRGLEVNADVRRRDGVFLARVDLLARELNLIFEYEGDGHRTDEQQFRKDIARYGALEAEGYTVVRVTSRDLYTHRDEFGPRVRAAVDLAAERLHKSAQVSSVRHVRE